MCLQIAIPRTASDEGRPFSLVVPVALAPGTPFSPPDANAELSALRMRCRELEEKLARERAGGVARERSVAMLGHDLRNSLQSISFGIEQMKPASAVAAAAPVLSRMEQSCERMVEMVENVLDFARGRHGNGIALVRNRSSSLADEMRHVVSEVLSQHHDHTIDVDVALNADVDCDHRRIAQLLANLLTNAVVHGAADRPVSLGLYSDTSTFRMAVSNRGKRIPDDRLARLFEPFARGDAHASTQGMGLGLYIAAEIARAHGGVIDVESTDEATRFTFSMPGLANA